MNRNIPLKKKTKGIGYYAVVKSQVDRLHTDELKALSAHISKLIDASTPKCGGFVYVIRAENGLYKIGKTIEPIKRIGTLGVKLPFEIETELLIPCDDPYTLEHMLHLKYADKRVRGEWFKLTEQDIFDIREFKIADLVVQGDPVREWINSMCVFDANHYVTIASLYDSYYPWCTEHGVNPLSKPRLSKTLTDNYPNLLSVRQMRKDTGETARHIKGLRIWPQTIQDSSGTLIEL